MFLKNFAQYLISQNLQHLIVHVTNHCNFRCQHCFIDFSPKEDLQLDHFQRLGREVGKLFWLDIGGGEPFLRKDLADIVASFDAKIIQIPTNGWFQSHVVDQMKEMKKRVRSELSVSFSIDGLKEKHEQIRKKKGSYDQTWATFEKLRGIGGIKLKISTVLNRENADEMIDLMKEVRKRNPDFHSIILLRGEPINPEYGLPTMQQLHELAPKIFDILKTYDYGKRSASAHILRNYHRYLWNISLKTLKQHTQVIPCLAGRAHMVTWADGRVSACEMLPSIGNIKEKSWHGIMQSQAFKEQVQSIKDKKCFCTHNCAMLDSILFRPQSLPHLLFHEKIENPKPL